MSRLQIQTHRGYLTSHGTKYAECVISRAFKILGIKTSNQASLTQEWGHSRVIYVVKIGVDWRQLAQI
jgi:hypothetical protein